LKEPCILRCMSEHNSEFLTVRETATRLGQSEETVRRMVRAGELPASRAERGGTRAPWLIHAAALERQLDIDAQIREAKERLASRGVVTGRGPEFLEDVERRHGLAVAEQLRQVIARHDALYEAARAVDQHSDEYEHGFAELDEDEAIEQAAQRRVAWIRREERIQQRAAEILDEEDDEDE
jgi:excisionase family DNA binding protein